MLECHDNCNFSLWSPIDAGELVEDRAFSCFAQATSGDFTVGTQKLDEFCELLAYNYHQGFIDENDLNDVNIHRTTANRIGFDFDSLLDEEVDYCISKLEGELMKCF